MSKSAPDHVEELVTLSRAKGFLAREFLLWVWYRSEAKDLELEVKNPSGGGKHRATAWIDDRVVLESASGKIHENIMKGGTPADSEEAAAALMSGKSVKELKLGLNIEGLGDFTAVLNDEELLPRGLKLPTPEGLDEAAGGGKRGGMPLAVRLEQIELYLRFLDQLFAQFVEERMKDDWTTRGVPSMRKWIKTRRVTTEVLH